MTETVVSRGAAEPEIDEELLAEAQRTLGTGSRNEVLNAALRSFVENMRAGRRQALADLRQMSDQGLFDYAGLDEVDQ